MHLGETSCIHRGHANLLLYRSDLEAFVLGTNRDLRMKQQVPDRTCVPEAGCEQASTFQFRLPVSSFALSPLKSVISCRALFCTYFLPSTSASVAKSLGLH